MCGWVLQALCSCRWSCVQSGLRHLCPVPVQWTQWLVWSWNSRLPGTYTLNENICELHYSDWTTSFLIGLTWLSVSHCWIAFRISQQWYQWTTADANYPISIFQLNGAGDSFQPGCLWTALRPGLHFQAKWWQKSWPEPAFLQWKCRLSQTGSSAALVEKRYK